MPLPYVNNRSDNILMGLFLILFFGIIGPVMGMVLGSVIQKDLMERKIIQSQRAEWYCNPTTGINYLVVPGTTERFFNNGD